MKISVVIPAHNEEKYIARTLEAILKQNHSDFEVIVVCNACTDKTEEIARTFPVKVLIEEEKGVQRAREMGRLEAEGELIASLDADCLPDPDWLTKGERYFKDENVVAVTGPYDYFDSSALFRKSTLISQKSIYRSANIFLNYFKLGGAFVAGNCIIRASSLDKIGGYDTSIIFYGDDTDTAARLSSVGELIYSNDLIMRTSSRRFKENGFIKTLFLYLFYFFKVTFSAKIKTINQ